MTDAPWSLPADWRWSRFDEVARVASRLVDPAGHADSPHIAPNHIESQTGRLLPYGTVASDGVTSSKHQFSAGQVLYSKIRPYLAKVVVAEFDGLCSADMYPIESELESRFLKWWMLTREFTRRAAGEQARTVLPKINVRGLSALPVPVPPIAEQRRIVQTLEEHLSRLEAAERLSLAVARRLDTLRTSSIRNALDAAGGKTMSIDQLARSVRNGIFISRPKPTGTGVPILRIGAVRALALELTDLRFSERDEEELRAEGSLLSPGDLLFTRYNGNPTYVGACAVVPSNAGPLTYPDKLIRVVVDPAIANPQFVALACAVGGGRAQIQAAVKTTSGQAGISGRDLRRVSIRVPQVSAQEQIARDVMVRIEAVTSVQKSLSDSLRRAAGLRHALLTAAFSGQLADPQSVVKKTQALIDV